MNFVPTPQTLQIDEARAVFLSVVSACIKIYMQLTRTVESKTLKTDSLETSSSISRNASSRIPVLILLRNEMCLTANHVPERTGSVDGQSRILRDIVVAGTPCEDLLDPDIEWLFHQQQHHPDG